MVSDKHNPAQTAFACPEVTLVLRRAILSSFNWMLASGSKGRDNDKKSLAVRWATVCKLFILFRHSHHPDWKQALEYCVPTEKCEDPSRETIQQRVDILSEWLNIMPRGHQPENPRHVWTKQNTAEAEWNVIFLARLMSKSCLEASAQELSWIWLFSGAYFRRWTNNCKVDDTCWRGCTYGWALINHISLFGEYNVLHPSQDYFNTLIDIENKVRAIQECTFTHRKPFTWLL